MKLPIWFVAPVLALAIAACDTVNPTVSQLEDAKTSSANQQFAAVASTSVDCQPDEVGCAQLHFVKADSCRRLAKEGDTSQLDCAVANYDAALVANRTTPDPRIDEPTLQIALLESIHARREASSGPAVARDNDLLLARATAATSSPKTSTAGFYYVANAELNSALRTPPPGGCDGVARADASLTQANAEGTAFAQNADTLARAIDNTRRSRGC